MLHQEVLPHASALSTGTLFGLLSNQTSSIINNLVAAKGTNIHKVEQRGVNVVQGMASI